MIKYLLPLLLLCACTPDGYEGNFLNVTNYSIKGDYKVSPGGVKVYTNGNNIDLNAIDLTDFLTRGEKSWQLE